VTNHVLFAVVVAGGLLSAADAQPPATVRDPGDNVILVTLDGARTQEVFGGLDREVLASTLKADQPIEQSPTFTRYNAATREERRQKLMPFLWQLMATAGSIAGDQTIGSTVQLRNRLWFSYPGYAEILLGEPHDDTLKSNDPIRNPYTTVLATSESYLKAHPETVNAVVDAVREGWQSYLANPEKANAHMGKLNTTMSAETFKASAEAQKGLIESEDTKKSGIGSMKLERWQTLVQQLVDLKVIDKPLEPQSMFRAVSNAPSS